MLHILFMILKITGIIIAVILGLVLALLLVVLFVPLRYRINSSCDGSLDSLEVDVRFSWLLHLISGYFVFKEKETDWQARIAWKKLNIEETEKPKKDLKVKKSSEKTKVKAEEPQRLAEQVEKAEKVKLIEEQPVKIKKRFSIVGKVKDFFENIKYTITKMCDTIKVLFEKKEKLVEFLNHKIHRNAFTKTKQEIMRLCKFLKPKKIKGHIHYGFEDPYTTGTVLAGASILYPFYGSHVTIQPDFENQVFEGELYVTGRIRVIYAIIVLFHLIINEDMKITYQHIKTFQL